MLFQRTRGLGKMIHDYGCYFMCLIWYAALYKLEPFDVESVKGLYDLFIKKGWMNEKCFIHDPEKILLYLGLNVAFLQEHSPPDRVCAPNEFEILFWEYEGRRSQQRLWRHFTAGNGNGYLTYDPWPNSITANYGGLVSKRIFRFV